jgi:hypothetical protein
MSPQKRRAVLHLLFLLLSIGVAVTLAVTGIFDQWVASLGRPGLWIALPAGFAFVSIFTAAPASVLLYQLGAHEPILPVTLLASFGAVIADVLIYRFIRHSLFADLKNFISHGMTERFAIVARNQKYHWFLVILGAIAVASPFPDEVGLALMGVRVLPFRIFLPLVFALDFLGILALVLIGAATT